MIEIIVVIFSSVLWSRSHGNWVDCGSAILNCVFSEIKYMAMMKKDNFGWYF
jgi:hypothetical protein